MLRAAAQAQVQSRGCVTCNRHCACLSCRSLTCYPGTMTSHWQSLSTDSDGFKRLASSMPGRGVGGPQDAAELPQLSRLAVGGAGAWEAGLRLVHLRGGPEKLSNLPELGQVQVHPGPAHHRPLYHRTVLLMTSLTFVYIGPQITAIVGGGRHSSPLTSGMLCPHVRGMSLVPSGPFLSCHRPAGMDWILLQVGPCAAWPQCHTELRSPGGRVPQAAGESERTWRCEWCEWD